MKKFNILILMIVIIIAVFSLFTVNNNYLISRIDHVVNIQGNLSSKNRIIINYPLNDSIFPPEIAPPTFKWQDLNQKSNAWFITVKFKDDNDSIKVIVKNTNWEPTERQWDKIKNKSIEKKAEVSIFGINENEILSFSNVSIMTSKDKVEDSILYREVLLPFRVAEKKPRLLRWRCGNISLRRKPDIILENVNFCANCHSFSRNGGLLGMNVKYNNDESSYILVKISNYINFTKDKIINWSRIDKNGKYMTFGKGLVLSPDGKYIVISSQDKFVSDLKDDISFSQNTFPIRGNSAVYSIKNMVKTLLFRVGEPNYVYSPQTWSEDGKHIIYARAKAYTLDIGNKFKPFLHTRKQLERFYKYNKSFLYDLYRVPFNNGKGGKPEAIKGASHNGMSNYFPRYSPDSKWIVFCKAKSYMLLQPDSKLYIIPSQGGIAREMRCNTKLMNSWHSWSSNSRWLVFSSKANTPYTQMFLTHIDEKGQDSPPILLEHFCSSDRAINMPEFVDKKYGMIKKINIKF